jgi:hypothetical protein
MNDNERRAITLTIYIFLSVGLLAAVGILISGILSPSPNAYLTRQAAIVSIVLCLGLLGLTVLKQFWIPRLALPVLAYLLASYLVMINFGVRDTTVNMFPVAIALAGLLLGRGGIVVFALLSMTTLFSVGLAEYTGRLVTPLSGYTTLVTVITSPTLMGLTSLMIYLMVDYLQRSLQQTRQNEHTLAEQNQQLEAYRNTLETQVSERTRAAETARQQAEAAQYALEDEIWFSKGLLPLNQALSGEQELAPLAAHAIRVVCNTLQAPVGVLYLLQAEHLEVAAAHALLHGDAQPRRLRIGEGFAGQAALERKPVILRGLLPEHLTITSGLGNTAPAIIAAWPMLYGETLVGALELGFLDEMLARDSVFLDRAAALIAVALHTAQSRQRINALLAETQAQARELQTREEELRAINEELEA